MSKRSFIYKEKECFDFDQYQKPNICNVDYGQIVDFTFP